MTPRIDDQGPEGRTVLHILPSLDEDRVVRAVMAVSEAWSRLGGRVLVAAGKGTLVGELQAEGAEWISFDAGTWNPATALGNIAHLRGLFDREAVDLVHVHAHARLPALSGRLAARLAHIPVITSLHGGVAQGWAGRLAERALIGAAAVTAPSRYGAEVLRSRLPSQKDRIHAVSPGLDLKPFQMDRVSPADRAAFRLAAGLDGSERVVIQHAPFHPDKGQTVLIDAVRLLVNGGLEGTVFLIACDGAAEPGYPEALEARILAQGVGACVRLMDEASGGPAALASAHLAVLPSVAPDPVGRPAVEAAAMGLPLVVSDHGALVDIVLAPPAVEEADATGFRVRPGDAMALARGIGHALELAPRSRIAMAGRAAATARRFSRARLQDQITALYAKVLDGAMLRGLTRG